jgi:adenylate cyclase
MTDISNNAELEIEVTYLPKQVPDGLLAGSPTRIVDIYLSGEGELLTKLRLRQRGTKYEITKKVNLDPNDLSLQDEYTIPLTEKEFTKLRSIGGREVVKDRYLTPLGEHMMEIDVFRDRLEGLTVIEVEFKSKAKRDEFLAPDYFGKDVTQEDFIAGAYLAGKSYKDIESDIARLH